ncbi:MAG: hypothetical protein M3Z54_11180 [Gemmatimonadota bacterium]|nr:hypothetical protein [Gemmatimonadota bacterium]
MAKVQVDLIGDAKDVSREINKTIREVSLLGQAIDTSNDIAVRTWKNSANAAKEYLNVAGATTEQQLKLEVAMRRTEDRLASHAGATARSTRNMGFFSALTAEASEHLGEHSLAIGRVERNLASFAEKGLDVNSTLGLMVTSLGKFAIGSVEITAVLAGIDAIIGAYDYFTKATREATKAQEALVKAGESRWQAVGIESPAAKEFNAMLVERVSLTKQLSEAEALHDRQLNSVLGRNQAKVIQRDVIDPLEKKLHALQLSINEAETKGVGKLKTVTTHSDEKKNEAEAHRLFLAQLHEAERMGKAAIAALDKRMKDDEKTRDDLGARDVKLQETKASAMDIASPAGALSHLAVIKAKHDLRMKEIDETIKDADLMREAKKQAGDEELAEIEALNRRIAAENARHDATEVKREETDAKKHEAIVKRKAQMIESAENGAAQAIISGRKDLGRALLRAALEPEIKLMEGLAAKQFALAAGDFADGNWAGGAHHLVAGAVFATEAGVIAGIAQGGGGGAGGAGGSGGGAGSAGAQLGARGVQTDQLLKIEIVNVTKDQNGREVARTSQMIQRLNDLNMPVRVTL